MGGKKVNYYLVKVNRLCGWMLLVLMPIVIITGYGIAGDYRWTSAIASAELHAAIHKFFMTPMIVVLTIHASLSVYFAIRRWRNRWNKKLAQG